MSMPIEGVDPKLRAGWEADTPEGDSLLRRFLVNWTASLEANGVPTGGRAIRRDDLAAVDLGRPAFGGNVATLLAPLFPADAKEVMGFLDEFYGFAAGGRRGAVTLFSPWPTPDLRPFGWRLDGYEPLMLRPVGGEFPPAPSGLRIEQVRDDAGLRAFEVAIVRGFGTEDPEMLRPNAVFGQGVLRDERIRLWVGWDGDQAVSAAAAFVAAGINDVTLVGTVPEARRRGYGAALTMRATLADPALPSMLLATDEGRPVYERLGYLSLFRWPVWSRERPGEG